MIADSKAKYCFQNCQKLVIFSMDESAVLLAKRKGENDFDGVYSFVGGKMETTDESIIAGMQREKNEEVGSDFKIKLYPVFNTVVYFLKKDGSSMILPHYYCQHVSGEIELNNEEYSDCQWVPLDKLENFESKIGTMPGVVEKLLRLKQLMKEEEFVII